MLLRSGALLLLAAVTVQAQTEAPFANATGEVLRLFYRTDFISGQT